MELNCVNVWKTNKKAAVWAVLPLVLTLSNGAFMSTYAAYFKIKEIMIDPYADKPAAPTEEPLAKDDVSN